MIPAPPMPDPCETLASASRLTEIEPQALVTWLVALSAVAGLALLLMTLVRQIKGASDTEVHVTNQPLRTEAAEAYATRTELRDMEGRLEKDIAEVKTEVLHQRDTARVSIGNIHSRIDTLAKNTDEMRGEVREISRNLQTLVKRAMREPDHGRDDDPTA